MGLIDFVPSAGVKDPGVTAALAAASTPNTADLEQKAADSIRNDVTANGLTADGLDIAFDAATATVTVQGEAPDQVTKEKILLVCGNIKGVTGVNDEMSVTAPSDPSQLYTVTAGDNLAKIAAQYYGNANDYPKIVDANQPMIVNADRIYPGQLLRIPPKTW
ncbi:peptidoglycan-binding protein LysM [Kitasatospora mediocidica]|uniref:peptidoglycan-binding protein LysM n=1 Tax=Kitasatospora mediocidica TaxID=58352 RepID=UPI000563D9C7|nr:peptidoglycan-binding protein LysM [Kitasatospora mediocidica]